MTKAYDERALKHRAIEKHRKEIAQLKGEINILKRFAVLVEQLDKSQLMLFVDSEIPQDFRIANMISSEMSELLLEYASYKHYKVARRKGRRVNKRIERLLEV